MAIEIFDKGICIAAFYVRFDPDAGANGTNYLSGQGVSGITSEGTGSVVVQLTEELPPLLTDLEPADDTVHLEILHAVQNKNAPVAGPACVVTFEQIAGNRIRCQGFSGLDMTPGEQSFWAFVFRVPLVPVANSEVPGGV